MYDVPLRIQLLATAGQMWNSSSPLQNIWNKKKVTLHPINHFQSRLKLIMDLSIKINVVINLQVKSSFSNSKYCMFKANSYYYSVYCFIDNFNIYWLVKNIWHAWNIYICNVIFYLHAHQAKEKNGQHLTKIHHINLISGKKNQKQLSI